MKTTKYDYTKVIQQSYGQGWEDVSEYEADSQGLTKEFTTTNGKREKLITHDLREYRTLGYPTRVIFRRTLKEKTL